MIRTHNFSIIRTFPQWIGFQHKWIIYTFTHVSIFQLCVSLRTVSNFGLLTVNYWENVSSRRLLFEWDIYQIIEHRYTRILDECIIGATFSIATEKMKFLLKGSMIAFLPVSSR